MIVVAKSLAAALKFGSEDSRFHVIFCIVMSIASSLPLSAAHGI